MVTRRDVIDAINTLFDPARAMKAKKALASTPNRVLDKRAQEVMAQVDGCTVGLAAEVIAGEMFVMAISGGSRW